MVVVWGTRMMGKVDAVPGVGHVATRFFYLQFVPLVPVETMLIFHEEGEQIYGVKIPFSPKSILVAWFRTACVFAAIGMGVGAALSFTEREPLQGVLLIAGAVLAAALFIYTYYFRPIARASYGRAMQLAQKAGLGAEQVLLLQVQYGRMSADEADRELGRIYEQAQQEEERQRAQESEIVSAEIASETNGESRATLPALN